MLLSNLRCFYGIERPVPIPDALYTFILCGPYWMDRNVDIFGKFVLSKWP